MARKTIALLGDWINKEHHSTAAAITPGDLLVLNSSGNVLRHNVAAAFATPVFALENMLIGNDIDTDYANEDLIQTGYFQKGAEVFAFVGTSAAAIVIGDPLESDGSGSLRIVAGDVAGARAEVTIGITDAAVEFQATFLGLAGNDITIQYIASTAGAATVVVTDNAIVIKPDNTTPGTSDQANDVITLVNASAEASALVVARIGAGGDGTDAVVTPVSATNLAGGLNTTANIRPVATALEAVDNSSNPTTRVRIIAEIT